MKVLSTMVGIAVAMGSSVPSAAVPESVPDFIAVNARGSAAIVDHDGVITYSSDLYSLTTSKRIGTFQDQASCTTGRLPQCLVYDVTTTFKLPGGEIRSRGLRSVVPDANRPGFASVASHPDSDTIVSTSGRFEGRSGKVVGWGSADMRAFPRQIGSDLFTLIRFDGVESNLLGSREVFAGRQPAGKPQFQAQLFRSNGVDENPNPTRFFFTTPLYSLVNGAPKGMATDDFTCGLGPPPCLVLDILTIFRFMDGQVTVRQAVTVVPDPQRPGFALLVGRPTKPNMIQGTGAYAGRTGTLLVSGEADLRNPASSVPIVGISMLNLDD